VLNSRNLQMVGTERSISVQLVFTGGPHTARRDRGGSNVGTLIAGLEDRFAAYTPPNSCETRASCLEDTALVGEQ
jgi:hypothetical protein